MIKEVRIPKPMEAGTWYGYPIEIWDTFTPQQRQSAADIFRMAYPALAMPEGAREFLGTDQLTPSALGSSENSTT